MNVPVNNPYTVFFTDYGEDEKVRVSACSPQHAAEKAVEKWESDFAQYDVAAGSMKVNVAVHGLSQEWHFEVSGETVPHYYAKAKEPAR